MIRALSKTKNELVLLAAIVSVSSVFMGAIMYAVEVRTNQNTLFRSRDWLSANQGAVFLISVSSVFTFMGAIM